MKVIYFLTMLCISLSLYGKKDPYRHEPEQKAIKTAFKILKIYFPAEDLCVADSVYNLDWTYFQNIVDDATSTKLIDAFITFYDPEHTEPYHSKEISRLLCSKSSPNCKYITLFSEPYRNLIRCDVIPAHKNVGTIIRPKTGYMFLFQYESDGEIIQVSKVDAEKAESIVDY